MKRSALILLAAAVLCVASVQADTVAYWRFEEGPAGTPVIHTTADGVFDGTVQDWSGNGYNLSAWNEGGAGYTYRSDVAGSEVDGMVNNFSVKNSGGGPAMWTETGAGIQTISPAAFTIEATFKLENGGYKTIVGRDSIGTNTAGDSPNGDLAALYFQAIPNNGLAIKFCDVSGYWHEALAAENSYVGFNWSEENPDGDPSTPWYSMAAVSDGANLSLYLRNVTAGDDWGLIAYTDLTLSGSPDTALTAGAGDGGDWDAGNWTVGRGLYAGGHGDRAYGFLDEIRISDSALSTEEFLMVVPEPATLALLGLGALVLRRKK